MQKNRGNCNLLYLQFPFSNCRRKKMPRIARKDLGTPFLHVMVQGVNKEYIFYKDEYIEKYLELMKNKIRDYNIEMLAYCMMNNHAHFLMYAELINELGKFMQKVNLNYSQMYNRNEKRCGVLFRNRYQAEPIYDIKYLVNCIKYIHNNPVKAKMVEKCEDYKYSSYNDYVYNKGLSQSKIIKSIFGEKCDFRELFNNTYDKKYMDIEDDNEYTIDDYITQGIAEFKQNENTKIEEIFGNRNVLKRAINYLNKCCGIKYVEIEKYFEISKGTMGNLKIK